MGENEQGGKQKQRMLGLTLAVLLSEEGAARCGRRKKKSGADRWTQARRQQEDGEHIHSAGVDTCEARLENLRYLYEAGLLDEDEYRQRVARIREKHNG